MVFNFILLYIFVLFATHDEHLHGDVSCVGVHVLQLLLIQQRVRGMRRIIIWTSTFIFHIVGMCGVYRNNRPGGRRNDS